MAYQKPMCECGEELVYEVEKIVTLQYKIKKDGRRYAKPIIDRYASNGYTDGFGRLVCPECSAKYEYNMFFKDGRFIRDEQI